MTVEPFVLDLDSNPHPRMLAGALAARRGIKESATWSYKRGYWAGYLNAMCDATGCDPDDLEAWMDRHEADS